VNFTDKTAIVTGGSRGIGFAIAKVLCEVGTNVMICGRNKKTIQKAVDSLELFGTVAGVQCDVTNYDEVCAMMQATKKKFGGIQILINNAGIGHLGGIEEQTPETWTEIINTNLTGVFYCCKEVVPSMKERGGYIINISSRVGTNPFAGDIAYTASKFGLNGFSEALLLNLKKHNIRVSYLMPGRVSTDFGGEEPQPWHVSPEDIAKVVLDILSLDERSVASRVEIRPSQTHPIEVTSK
jgi:NAD(P)-dependent dehydrogenase (short-subunit alcohol dehydrogenase family)